MTWVEVAEALKRTDIVLIPIGSTEQHGLHLPLGVDTFIPIALAEEIAKRVDVVIAPPLWYGDCPHHMGFPGTISIRPEILVEFIYDVCKSLIKHGFRKILLLNGHTIANNPALLIAIERIQEETDAKVYLIDLLDMAITTISKIRESEIGGIYHACELETSQMLTIRPDLVYMENAKKVIPKTFSKFIVMDGATAGDRVLSKVTMKEWKKLTDVGSIGDPTIATAEKGKIIMKALVENIVAFINELKSTKQAGA
jgi:creatinine amidohydrolase